MYSVTTSLRDVQSAGSVSEHSASPYNRPQTTSNMPDKSSIIWKDFIHAVKKRRGMLKRLRDAALDSATPLSMLKKMLLDIRQTTLTLIEDALEIEYRTRMSSSKSSKRSTKFGRLPPITSFRAMEEKEDMFALVEAIDDVQELFSIPNIKVMLPLGFPSRRNPFLLSKTVDELAVSNPPHPEAGNVEEELKVLELLRYKRAARALLRAEAQVLNRLPLELGDLETLLERMKDDFNIEKMFRAVCTILDNDKASSYAEDANFSCLLSPVFNIEAHEFLTRLNQFQGAQPMRIDVQVAIRQKLRESNFDYLQDPISKFLLEWMELVLNATQAESSMATGSEFRISTASQKNRGKTPSLASIVEAPLEYVEKDSPQQNRAGSSHMRITEEVTSSDYDKTHEKITPNEVPRRKMLSPMSKRPSSVLTDRHAPDSQSSPNESPSKAHDVGTEPMESSKLDEGEGQVAVVQKKRMKRKAEKEEVIREFDTSAAPPAIIKKKIRTEVERVIREMGLAKRADEETSGNENISAIRYELQKMQQELLRRQVLDPKHYTVTSVDSVAHAQQGLTVGGVNAFDPLTRRRKAKAEEQQILSAPELISEKTIQIIAQNGDPFNLLLSLIIDHERECLVGEVQAYIEDAYKYKLLAEYKPLPANVDSSMTIRIVEITITKLIYSHITEYNFNELLEAKPPMRSRMVQKVMEEIEVVARSASIPHGTMALNVDRVLFSNKFAEDNVLVDLVISRNNECDGLTIYCTPLAGLFQAHKLGIGPIVINLHDNELEVLLINQHGLFMQAKEQWSSMKIIAQWLANKVKVRKVPAATFNKPAITLGEDDEEGTVKEDAVSVTSQITYTPRKLEYESVEIGGEREIEEANISDLINPNTLLLLEVTLSRKIELTSLLLEHWKSRNIPKIVGLECVVEAVQEMETMRIDISLTVPSKKAYKRLIADSKKGGDMIDMEDYSDDDEDYALDNGSPTIVIMSLQLTRPELLIFGNAPSVESKAIGMTRSTEKENAENHPESLLWNVMNRLVVKFKGSKNNPYKTSSPASDLNNWSLQFDRQLLRDVRTISKHILMVSVQAVGSELVLEPKPVNTSAQQTFDVLTKRLTEDELIELVKTEGWPLKWLSFEKRKDLASALLDKLKVITDERHSRLELVTYVETRMITVTRTATVDEFEAELGTVEITNQTTLSDLRILIKHELDPDELPQQFRFLYKGVLCSLRQETFRRAWDCLPACYITPKLIETIDMGVETEDIAQKRMLQKVAPKKEAEGLKLVKGQRRVPGKYSPIPLATLCTVQEGKAEVYLLHDGGQLLIAGDIIRIGNVLGRDYLVSAVGRRVDQYNVDNRVIFIDPEYDLISEPDFHLPIMKNTPWPVKDTGVYLVEFVKKVQLLKDHTEQGVKYELPEEMEEQVERTNHMMDTFAKQKEEKEKEKERGKERERERGRGGDDNASYHTNNNSLTNKTKPKKIGFPRAFQDVWIWKCIPSSQDNRPKWRVMYDEGLVHYSYDYRNSEEFAVHFRVKANYAYLEVLCTDVRVPSLSLHCQRVNEMRNISIEYYVRLVFDRMTEWLPVYRKGIDRAKFLKLLREVSAFPDLKRPARVAQLENLFQKLVKGEYGIVQKYLSYPGFVQLMKDTALLRFPPKRRKKGSDEGDEGSTAGKKEDEDESSVMTDEMSSMGDDLAPAPALLKRSLSKANNKRTSSASSLLATKKPMKKDNTRKKLEGVAEEGAGTGGAIDPEQLVSSYHKFILDYAMTYPTWYDAPWKDAKLAAMKKEAIPYCAATRLAALFRGALAQKKFRFFIQQHVKLQANIRRKLSAKKTAALKQLYVEDYCVRMRYFYATCVNSLVRMFLKRCWYLHVLEQIKRQQVIMLKARRQKLKKLRQAEKKTLIYCEAVKMNGLMVFITLLRKDPRNYTKDYGVFIHVYVPVSQQTFRFLLEDNELRAYMAIELDVQVVTVGEILDVRNLKRLMTSRLIVHKANSKNTKPAVILSKHALGQKGEIKLTRAVRIKDQMFICKVFETVEELSVQCYHTISSKIFTVRMSTNDMRAWVKDEYVLQHKDTSEYNVDDPPILHPKKKRAYHNWILNHLTIDTRRGQFKVLFSCHLLKSQKKEMVIKIQSIWRKALVKPTVISVVEYWMLKVYATPGDPATAYYLNRHTGGSAWERPKLLGRQDLPTHPTSHWEEIYYEDEYGQKRKHFVNPYTGFYTHLVPDQAARIIQALARNYLLKTISMPQKHFIKAGSIYKTAQKKFDHKNGGGAVKLSAVVNLAICKHVIDLDEEQAKELYRQAVDLSEVNPLVTRCYAFFLIGTCQAPTALNRERASVLLRDADRKDPSRDSFQAAYYLFQFAALRQPFEVKTLLNLALVQCYIYPETKTYVAEKLLRRALALQPFDERVMEIWKLLRDRFPERQLLYSSMMRKTTIDPKLEKKKVVHGREVIENRQWAGWLYVQKDTFNVSKKFAGLNRPYWYNPATGEERDSDPDFKVEWVVRKGRSHFQSGGGAGLEVYYDPLTADYFEYFPLIDSYQ